MKKIIIVASFVFLNFLSYSQTIVPCKTDELYLEAVKLNPELIKAKDEATQIGLNFTPQLRKKGVVRYIPVVFHIIHKNGLENISQTQVNDAIRILNEDFRKLAGTNGGASTDPSSADMEYEFRLAQFDPNGQPSNGVNRVYSIGTDNAGNSHKGLSYWDARKYFNVWVVSNIADNDPNSTILGYAQFPFQINSNTSTDGIMCRADQLGIIEMASVGQAGRTVTHEAGHWLGLYHPFQNGCVGTTASTCASQGDEVCDTPPVASATNGCPNSRNSCTETNDKADLIKNYMDYANGNCMDMFTAGQKTKVDGQMAFYRSNVYSTNNLSAAGLNSNGTYKTLTAASRKAPYTFNFSSSLAGTGWRLENYMSPGDSGWQYNAVFSGNDGVVGCMASMNLQNWRTNVRNAFSSPDLDISALSSPRLTFQIAYSKRTTASGDRLRVFISNSYGRSEVLLRTITATEMETGSPSTSPFTPASNQWKKYSIDLSAYKSYTNCRIRFELQSLRGNNIYIDDFAITEPTSLEDLLKSTLKFNAYPNPANSKCNFVFELETPQTITILLKDLQGRLVKEILDQRLNAGPNEVETSLEGLPANLYIIELQAESGRFLHKLMIE
jgi:hypothetical protein